MDLVQFYNEIGVDSDMVVRRLGLTEKHLIKYLGKFRLNQEYDKLVKAVEEKDYYNVEWAAHTLKGVTSNLGLENLFEDFQELVNCVRNKKTDLIPEVFEKTRADYLRIMKLLTEMNLEE